MSGDRLVLLTPLRQALERIERKAAPLLDVICMQFLAVLLICQDALPGVLIAIRSLEEQASKRT